MTEMMFEYIPDPGIALILLSIMYLGRVLKTVFVGRAQRFLQAAAGKGPVTGICSGTLVTVLVQSSSTTTSIIVPLAGISGSLANSTSRRDTRRG